MSETETHEVVQQPTILVSGQITQNTETGVLNGTASLEAMVENLRAKGVNAQMVDHRDYIDEQTGDVLSDKLSNDLYAADGLVILGNDQDIDPSEYGAQPHPETKSETARQSYDNDMDYAMGLRRSKFEMAATKQALTTNIPILGICAGMQRMNVVAGGSLHQHIDGAWRDDAKHTPVKYVQVEKGSKLAAMADATCAERNEKDVAVNSIHHQAIDQLGAGFKATAHCASDGADGSIPTVQAIESTRPHQFAMGVQWHPELIPGCPLSQTLFEELANAARDRMQAKAVGSGGHAAALLAAQAATPSASITPAG